METTFSENDSRPLPTMPSSNTWPVAYYGHACPRSAYDEQECPFYRDVGDRGALDGPAGLSQKLLLVPPMIDQAALEPAVLVVDVIPSRSRTDRRSRQLVQVFQLVE